MYKNYSSHRPEVDHLIVLNLSVVVSYKTLSFDFTWDSEETMLHSLSLRHEPCCVPLGCPGLQCLPSARAVRAAAGRMEAWPAAQTDGQQEGDTDGAVDPLGGHALRGGGRYATGHTYQRLHSTDVRERAGRGGRRRDPAGTDCNREPVVSARGWHRRAVGSPQHWVQREPRRDLQRADCPRRESSR